MALERISNTPTIPEIINFLNELVDELGNKLDSDGQALDSLKLNGKEASYYALASDLDDKLDVSGTAADSSKLGGIDAELFAKLASPAFSGTPTAPTAPNNTNNTQIATTAFVKSLVGAANNGGIIAASLAQNGYVKFANGLILQWGVKATTEDASVTFPIAFSKVYVAVLNAYGITNKAGSVYGYSGTKALSITELSFFGGVHCTGKSWIVLGK